MKKLSFTGIAVVLFGVLYLPTDVHAASPQIFVSFGGMTQGYSTDPNHLWGHWTDVLSVSDGLVGPSLPFSSPKTTPKDFSFSPIQITKVVDGDSPELRRLLTQGGFIMEFEVELTLPNDTKKPILRIRMRDALITSLTMAVPSVLGYSASDTTPVSVAKETITILPGARVSWESWSYDLQNNQTSYTQHECFVGYGCF